MNFRIDAEVARAIVPLPFRPKLHGGYAIGGICLIRLEELRPDLLPKFLGFSSENAAHRIAVTWEDQGGMVQEGVYIPRRDSNFWLSRLAGGKLFPGEQNPAEFVVTDDGARVSINARSQDRLMSLNVQGIASSGFPGDSCFSSLTESSAFFEGGSTGYSATRRCDRFDGIELETRYWEVQPFEIEHVQSSFFDNRSVFPEGSVTLDHALVMRNIPHRWVGKPDLVSER